MKVYQRNKLLNNLAYKEKNLENVKERLAKDAEYKVRNLKNVRERLKDAEYKKRNLENVKARIVNDAQYRERNFQNVKLKRKYEKENGQGKDQLYATFHENIKDGPMHVCTCCGQLNFKSHLSEIKKKKTMEDF